MFVSGGAVTDDIVGTDDPRAKVTVIFVQTRIRHGHDLPGAVKVGGVVRCHGVGLHVLPGFVVEGGKGRVGSKVHHRGLHQHLVEGNILQHTFVAALVPSPRVDHRFLSHFAERLNQRSAFAIGEVKVFNGACVISPTVQAKQTLLQGHFAFSEENHVEQITIQKHAERDGMTGEQTVMCCGLMQGEGGSLNDEP